MAEGKKAPDAKAEDFEFDLPNLHGRKEPVPHVLWHTHTHRVIKCYKINRIQHFNSGTLLVGKVFELGLSGYGEREHGASEHHKRNIR